jgi:hypothetical protein
MSEATIRTAIYDAVKGVGGIGTVYNYERHATTWDDFLNLFKSGVSGSAQVRGWMIGYRGIVEASAERFSKASHRTTRKHRFHIMGIMAINDEDESEKTFAALAEDVCDALESNATLQAFAHISPAILGFDPSPFAGVLVHAAVINLEVTEVI